MGWLVPVGIPGGVNSGFEGIPAGSGIVRFGGQLICLDVSHYRLWRAAAAAPQAGQLIAWGTAQGIPDAADRVHQLQDAGLLIAEGPDVQQRVGGLALHLLGECLGNGADLSPVFFVLGRNKSKLQVDAYLFDVLLHSGGAGPVSVTCDALDAARPAPAYRPSIETLTEALPLLVRNEVVRLGMAAR